jgi:hypothetical protein
MMGMMVNDDMMIDDMTEQPPWFGGDWRLVACLPACLLAGL